MDGNYKEFVDLIDMVVFEEFELEGRKILEGYSAIFNEYIVINNKKINVQISVCDNQFLVGLPLIKNSF